MSHVGRTLTVLIAALLGTLAAPTPGFAQRTRGERAYRGLFGSSGSSSAGPQLDLNASASWAYDDNVLADSGGDTDPRFQKSGAYESVSLALDYLETDTYGSLDFSGGGSYRYYPSVKQMTGTDFWASTGLSAKLSPRDTVRMSAVGSYMPYYTFDPYSSQTTQAGDVLLPSSQQSLIGRAAIRASVSTAYDHQFTKRATMAFDGSIGLTDFRHEAERYKDYAVGGRFVYRLSTRMSAKLGYRYRRGEYSLFPGAQPIEGHDLDIGIDYNRALSVSRKTTISFSSGSTAFRSYGLNGAGYGMHYGVVGHVALNREIGRSWSARVNYDRGLQFVPGLFDAFFTDSVALGVGGFVGRRIRVNAGGNYAVGAYGPAGGRNYATYSGNVSAQIAVWRFAALSTRYFYYHYKFDGTVSLPTGVRQGIDRQGVSAGLDLWLPLFR
jgi:hypothetical protein